jgi:hypothetical protein
MTTSRWVRCTALRFTLHSPVQGSAGFVGFGVCGAFVGITPAASYCAAILMPPPPPPPFSAADQSGGGAYIAVGQGSAQSLSAVKVAVLGGSFTGNNQRGMALCAHWVWFLFLWVEVGGCTSSPCVHGCGCVNVRADVRGRACASVPWWPASFGSGGGLCVVLDGHKIANSSLLLDSVTLAGNSAGAVLALPADGAVVRCAVSA